MVGSGRFAGSQSQLLETAAARCGLGDFGDPDYQEGLARLVDELDVAGLSESGAVAAREHLLSNLTARLRAVDGFKVHHEAMKRPIVRPLIVTGIIRSGTTALHRLLAIDPQFQGSEHWICAAPQPRPARPDWPTNPDFQASGAALSAMIAIAPEMLNDHGMAVDGVEESLNILSHSFHSNMYPSQYSLPRYDAWYRGTSDLASYRYLANVMRLIGANEPGRTWLLKNPTDTFSLAELLTVFPDAMIVQTHRDPVEAVPSVVNLIAGAHRMFRGEDGVDHRAIFLREQEMWALAMERAEAVKGKHPGQVFEVEFRRFVSDQLMVVREIYDWFKLELKAEVEAEMRSWLDRNPRRPGAIQRHRAEDFGGSSSMLAERNCAYRALRGYI